MGVSYFNCQGCREVISDHHYDNFDCPSCDHIFCRDCAGELTCINCDEKICDYCRDNVCFYCEDVICQKCVYNIGQCDKCKNTCCDNCKNHTSSDKLNNMDESANSLSKEKNINDLGDGNELSNMISLGKNILDLGDGHELSNMILLEKNISELGYCEELSNMIPSEKNISELGDKQGNKWKLICCDGCKEKYCNECNDELNQNYFKNKTLIMCEQCDPKIIDQKKYEELVLECQKLYLKIEKFKKQHPDMCNMIQLTYQINSQ